MCQKWNIWGKTLSDMFIVPKARRAPAKAPVAKAQAAAAVAEVAEAPAATIDGAGDSEEEKA